MGGDHVVSWRVKGKGYSMTTELDNERIRTLFKQAIVEALEERPDLFYGLFAEVIEDIGMANAIREGLSRGSADDYVDEETILALLKEDD